MAQQTNHTQDEVPICRSDEDDDLDTMVSFLRQNRPDLIDAMRATSGERPEMFFDEGEIRRHTPWFLKRVIRKITGSKTFKTPQRPSPQAKTPNRRPHYNELRELVATNSFARSRSHFGTQAPYHDFGARSQMYAPPSNYNMAANMMQPMGCGVCGQVHQRYQPCMSPYFGAHSSPPRQAYPVPDGFMYFPPPPPVTSIDHHAHGYADPRLSLSLSPWSTANASTSPPEPYYHDNTQEMRNKRSVVDRREKSSSEPASRVRLPAKSSKQYASPYPSNASSLASTQSMPERKVSWSESNETARRFDKMAFKSGNRPHKKYISPRTTSQSAYEHRTLLPALMIDSTTPQRSTHKAGGYRAVLGVPAVISEGVELPETHFVAPRQSNTGIESPEPVSHALKKSSGNIVNCEGGSDPTKTGTGADEARPNGAVVPKSKRGKKTNARAASMSRVSDEIKAPNGPPTKLEAPTATPVDTDPILVGVVTAAIRGKPHASANASVKTEDKSASRTGKLDSAASLKLPSKVNTDTSTTSRKEEKLTAADENRDMAAISKASVVIELVAPLTNGKSITKKGSKQRAAKKQPNAAKSSTHPICHTPEPILTATTTATPESTATPKSIATSESVLAAATKEPATPPTPNDDKKEAAMEMPFEESALVKNLEQKPKSKPLRATIVPAVPDLKLLEAKSPRSKPKPATKPSSTPSTPDATMASQTQTKIQVSPTTLEIKSKPSLNGENVNGHATPPSTVTSTTAPKPHHDTAQLATQPTTPTPTPNQHEPSSTIFTTPTPIPTATTPSAANRSRRSSAVQILKAGTTRRLSVSMAAAVAEVAAASRFDSSPTRSRPRAGSVKGQVKAEARSEGPRGDVAVVSSPSSRQSAGSPARRVVTPESSIEEVQE